MKIGTILEMIDLGSIALPEFQRGYVWNREQVRGLMHSLYRRHPVGSLLVWATRTESAQARGDSPLPPGVVKLLLDGQQRITSLYGIVRGSSPKFFEGNARAFTGLHFNLEEQTFEFYAPLKMKDNPLWIDVTKLMQAGVGGFIQRVVSTPELQSNTEKYLNRLAAVNSITQIELHIEEVTGDEKTVDVVVDIFNRVNSGGTKLSKGDLALAKICAQWPDARDEMNKRLRKWEKAGFRFRLELLLRCVNAIVTGEALFSALSRVDAKQFQQGLATAEKCIDTLLNRISGRLGLDHDRVLGSRSTLPLMSRYLVQRGKRAPDFQEWDKLLYWYVHTFLWGRYAGATETALNQDLAAIEDLDGALDRLIELLRQNRGDLRVKPADFRGHSRGARFYPLLYMMTRLGKSKDWESKLPLTEEVFGKLSRLQVHHIFPKAVLYKGGYNRSEVNAIANFTFLTQDTNLLVRDKLPEEYLREYVSTEQGRDAIKSHWIPMDAELWKVENYAQFLDARRELLAKGADRILESLSTGVIPETETETPILERAAKGIPGGVEDEEEERVLKQCNREVAELGFAEGQMRYELADPETGDALAILDLAWPNGLQEGLTPPVALLIEEGRDTEEAANRAGYLYFTRPEDLLRHVRTEILGEHDEANQGGDEAP